VCFCLYYCTTLTTKGTCTNTFGDFSTIFARVCKILSTLNSAKCFMWDETDELNCWNPFFGILRLMTADWSRQSKSTPLECIHFPSISLVYSKYFPVGCAQESRNSADKNLYSTLVRHFRIFLNVRIRYTHLQYALFITIVQMRCI